MPAPANDTYAAAQVLTGNTGSVGFDNVSATAETSEYYAAGGFTVWYAWTPADDGVARFDTASSPGDPDTYLQIFHRTIAAGVPTNNTDLVGFDDDTGNDPAVGDPTYGTSIATFRVTAGETYMIQVDSYAGSAVSDGVLTWSLSVIPPTVPLGIGDAAVGVEYVYLVHDATDGTRLAELPLSVSSFTRLLSGCGQLDATLPITHPLATRALLGPQDREITVLRNGAIVWHGPITYVRASLADPLLQITARETSWYLLKRTLEDDQQFSQDVLGIVRALVTYATAKAYGALYEFTVSSALAGYSRTWGLVGNDRVFILNAIDDLASHPTVGFDYRIDLSLTSAGLPHRHLRLEAPSIGGTVTDRSLEPGAGLYDLVDEADLDRAGNRIHVRPGTGVPTSLDNTAQLTAGRVLIEAVLSRPDLSSISAADVADEFRRLAQPPVRNYVASYIPRAALPFGWCNLGDLVPLKCDQGFLTVNESRRVKQISVSPPEKDNPELVGLTLTLPLDELGT